MQYPPECADEGHKGSHHHGHPSHQRDQGSHHHRHPSHQHGHFDNPDQYATFSEPLTFPQMLVLSNVMKINGAKNIIEVGCGPGAFSVHLLRTLKCEKFVGLDFEEKNIEYCKKLAADTPGINKNIDIQFSAGDMTDLKEFSNDSFDAYLCGMTLHHSSDPKKSLAEAYRITREGGRVGFLEIGHPHNAFMFKIRKFFEEVGVHASHQHNHNWFDNLDVLKEALQEANFKVNFLWKSWIVVPFYSEDDVVEYLEKSRDSALYLPLSDDKKQIVKNKIWKWVNDLKAEDKQPGI
eukprot:TRINITY_DN13847_c0_g1_i6.p1 TRINITY_DN13847_c0_g1~~TRINITY_DN13847_c0_g1_i6.p1  ORF type:complete len:293 (-),score=38.29 TRINITY_DN13847_c0_g1_i6:123-1001(-)